MGVRDVCNAGAKRGFGVGHTASGTAVSEVDRGRRNGTFGTRTAGRSPLTHFPRDPRFSGSIPNLRYGMEKPMWFGVGIVGVIIWIAIAFWPARVAGRKGAQFHRLLLVESVLLFPSRHSHGVHGERPARRIRSSVTPATVGCRRCPLPGPAVASTAADTRPTEELCAMTKSFKGKIELDIRDSTPDWEPFLAPSARAGAERAVPRLG